MFDPTAGLIALVEISMMYQYVWLAGFAWMVYDWLIMFSQEVDLVWRRSGAWQSTLLYVFTRYHGLAFTSMNLVVALRSGWSVKFCHTYFYFTGTLSMVQIYAGQGILLWRAYVLYERSRKVLITSLTLYVLEFVSLVTLYTVDIRAFKTIAVPTPVTGCYGFSSYPPIAKIYWCICFAFETYMCLLVLPHAIATWKSPNAKGVNLFNILVRDSLLWYICLGGCLFVTALSFTTKQSMLALFSIPALHSVSTVGGPRLLLNMRAAYFSPTRKPTSTLAGFPENSYYMETQGTVGEFRGRRRSAEGDTASIGVGVWAKGEDLEPDWPRLTVKTQPMILLQPPPSGRRKQKEAESSSMASRGWHDGNNSFSGIPGSSSDVSGPSGSGM